MSGDRLLVRIVARAGGWLGPLVVLTALGAAAQLLLPRYLGRALDHVVVGADAQVALLQTTGLLGVLLLVQVVSQLVTDVGIATAAGTLRRDLIRHMLAAGPSLAQRRAEGDLVARLVGSSAQSARIVSLVATVVSTVAPPIGGVIALALIDPWLAFTFAVGMLSASGAVRRYLRDAQAATTGYLEEQGSIAGRLVDALAGARTIAAARTVDREVARILTPLDALRAHGIATWRNMARLVVQGEPVVLLTQVAVIAVAGVGLSAGRLTPGEMLAASRYAVMAAGITTLLDKLAALTRTRAAAQRIAAVHGEPITTYGTRSLPDGPGQLELRNITAGWIPTPSPASTSASAGSNGSAHTASADSPTPASSNGSAGGNGSGGRPVLDGLDLVIPAGSMVALVGRSGAGKSLTAALAGRLSDPTAGQVLLDGVPLAELDRRSLRRAVTYAFERPSLLGGTVGAALAFGVDSPRPWTIRDAAQAAHADGFIRRLPGGYTATLADTPMSGGEIQRLGLARAMAHDARVLILDDATSSLDTATEAEIAAALTAQMNGRTRLIVTHRTTTAARADLVAWLDGGVIRACAPHDHLWTDPAYRAVFRPDTDLPHPQRPTPPTTAQAATPSGEGVSVVMAASMAAPPNGTSAAEVAPPGDAAIAAAAARWRSEAKASAPEPGGRA